MLGPGLGMPVLGLCAPSLDLLFCLLLEKLSLPHIQKVRCEAGLPRGLHVFCCCCCCCFTSFSQLRSSQSVSYIPSHRHGTILF